jgi:CRISPR-associated protein Cas1
MPACRSAYTLAHAEALRIAAHKGFDPTLGVYHDPSAGRDSLACDLVEPLRPLVDGFVHALFAGRRLRPRIFP